ncbi:DUF2024 family protein [Flavivirga spongiicola]|uniref:DUF2024 family protein n=1 Tax=Flavivirga spongiicola TaxID=421621 RepID=A0ABU7XM75_9FLAO|nr:DUF2024 family protein [Flavivirga sp. MEBiC05379]MDO5981533.1 DUF2024 family protein [Flavivirga sp. MEBiC05379]
MKVSVWDTYLKRENGLIMHFDILVDNKLTDETKILDFGKNYLKNKSFKSEALTSKKCVFCHIENASELVIKEIKTKGYYIIEMENCN